MAFSIKDAVADQLARRLATLTGETITEAVAVSLQERLRRVEGRIHPGRLQDQLMSIGRHCANLPELDNRTADEILGYDENGLPS